MFLRCVQIVPSTTTSRAASSLLERPSWARRSSTSSSRGVSDSTYSDVSKIIATPPGSSTAGEAYPPPLLLIPTPVARYAYSNRENANVLDGHEYGFLTKTMANKAGERDDCRD